MQNGILNSLALASALAVSFISVPAQQVLRSAESIAARPTPPAATAPTAVPALVPYAGVGIGADGKPLTGEVPVTFLIFKDETGGDPLFTESQTALFDSAGRYEVQLGATLSSGIPINLFGTGEARWLEVQIAGAKVASRALLVSVPYALKAGDASTLGGLPASAYALAGSGSALATTSVVPTGVTPDTGTTVTTTGGTSAYVPVFNGSATIIDSMIVQGTNGIGIGATPNSKYKLDVSGASILRGAANLSNIGNATTSAGTDSNALSLNASSYNSSSKAPVSPIFYLQAEPTGNNTTAPGATLNLLYNGNFSTGAETGLHFNSNGTITFASGQTFPGTGAGTITGVTAGTGLTGGGTSGKVALAVDTTVVPELAGTNSFSGSDTFVNSLYEDIDVNIDNKNANSGGISPGLRLGSASGEGMASKRTSGGNQYGVDLYTNYASRLAISSTGLVAIGSGDTFGNGQLSVTGVTSMDGGDFQGGSGGNGIQGLGGNSGGNNIPGWGGILEGGTGYSNNIAGGIGLYVAGGDSGSGTGGNAGVGIEANGGYSDAGSAEEGGIFNGGGSNTGYGGSGIVATPGYSSSNGYGAFAGEFNGSVDINGTVHNDVATTTLDHPLDPANKYLSLASIQSSEMVNMYSGNVTTDEQGLATVQLPSWFEAVNGDLRYQLTTVGHKAQAWISAEVKDGSFQIASDMANVKISWQITGVRQDAYAKAHPLLVEQNKEAGERGFYRHPELYGQPATKQIQWGRHPAMMRATQLAAAKTRHTVVAAK